MASRKPRYTIGLILSNVSNDFSGHLIEQMGALFTTNGYKLIVTCTNHNIDTERQMLRMFANTTDGILMISDALSYDEISDAIPKRIPVIFLNRKPEGCPHTCIIENDYSAVFQAILSNHTNGNDKVALICSRKELSTTKEILAAYKAAMSSISAGFHEDWIYFTDSQSNIDCATLISDIQEKGCNTILTATQTLTRRFLDYLMFYNQNSTQLMALIGFTNKATDSKVYACFDNITQPLQELVELSVQQMLYLIETPNTPPREYLLKGILRTHELHAMHVDINQEES